MTTISEEREAYERVGFRHRLRTQWGSVGTWHNAAGELVSYSTPRKVIEPATRLFAHISVTNPDQYSSNDAHARAIERIGISRFPNTGISYNELIMPGGHPYEGQPMGRRGAHTLNDRHYNFCYDEVGCPSRGWPLGGSSLPEPWNLNYNSRACCFARNVLDPVTDADIDAAAQWAAAGKLAGLVDRDARWHGHRCVSDKDCPGGLVWARMGDLSDLTADYVRRGHIGRDEDMQLSDKVQVAGEKAGTILGLDEITVDGALGYAAASLIVAQQARDQAQEAVAIGKAIAEKLGIELPPF